MKALFAGYFGFGNVGDEAILSGMLNDLHAVIPDLECIVLSGDPRRTRQLHASESILWNDIPEIREAVRKSDVVVIGGGGLFHDYWGYQAEQMLTPSHHGLTFVAGIALLADLYLKPCVVYAVGVGPLRSDAGKQITSSIFRSSELATVRDQASLEVLIGTELEEDKYPAVTADPAYRLFTEHIHSRTIFAGQLVNERLPLIGVNLRYWDFGVDQTQTETDVAKALDDYIDHYDTNLAFLPFQNEHDKKYEDDHSVLNRVRELMKHKDHVLLYEQPLTPELVAAAISECSSILAMRLHSAIFAMNALRPVVALAYDHKVESAMEAMGLAEYCLLPDAWNPESISMRLIQATSNVSQIQKILKTNRQTMVASAKSNAALFEQFLLTKQNGDVHQEFMLNQDLVLRHIDRESELERLLTRIGDLESRLQISEEQQEAKDNEIWALSTELELTNTRIDELQQEVEERDSTLDALREISRGQEERLQELSGIKSSAGWKLLILLWRIRTLLAPEGSSRERLFYQLKRALARRRPDLSGHRKSLVPGQMSGAEFAFWHYKERRRSVVPRNDLKSVRWQTDDGLVSIVLPVFNGERYVREAIESVLQQTYQDWELIAIDDGSEDRSGEILDEYADKDPRIYAFHQQNHQLPLTLSRGFDHARGEFLTWISSDNRFAPEFLERMVGVLSRHPHWDMAYANLDIIDAAGRPLINSDWYAGYQVPPGSEHIHFPEDPSELNIIPNNYVGAAFMYRDRVSGLLGGYSASRYTLEDYDYWMQVNSLLNLRHTDFGEPVYSYRFHSNSLTSQDQELGITRSRTKMMVFDDFRRDFYLSPLAWQVDCTPGTAASEVASGIDDHISEVGHIRFKPVEFTDDQVPGLWFPGVYISVVDEEVTNPAVPITVPASFLKVLVTVDAPSSSWSEVIGAEWDLCICMQRAQPAPLLPRRSQGWVHVTEMGSLITLIDIRARSHHLSIFEAELAEAEHPEVKASVVICTYRAGEHLGATLRSVMKQDISAQQYEVIVVNNDPDDDEFRHRLAGFRGDLSSDEWARLRIVECPFLGVSFARNIGISEARGEIICFIDDDAVADPGWLGEIWRAFEEHPEAGVVGGPITLQQPDLVPGWMRREWAHYWSHYSPGEPSYVQVDHWWEFPWGANWSARRSVLLEIGGFRTKYGRKGRDFSGGEEIIAAILIKRLGNSIAIEPAAKVIHAVEEDRFTLGHIWRTILSVRRMLYAAQRDRYLSREHDIQSLPGRLYNAVNKASLFIALAEINAEIHYLVWRVRDWFLRFWASLDF